MPSLNGLWLNLRHTHILKTASVAFAHRGACGVRMWVSTGKFACTAPFLLLCARPDLLSRGLFALVGSGTPDRAFTVAVHPVAHPR